jgi:hypothetical protein
MKLEQIASLLRPLPAYADTACSPRQVADPCSHVPLSGRRSTLHSPDRLIGHTRPHGRGDGAVPPARPGFRTVAHAASRSWKSRIKDSVRAARHRHGQPMDRAEVKRSARGEEVAATFPGTTTRSHLPATTPALCSEQGTRVSRGWETTALLPGGQVESPCKPTKGPACRLCSSSVQVRPVFLPPSSATLFLYLWPSIAGMFLQN